MFALGKLLNTPPRSIEILPGDAHDWPTDPSSPTAPYLFTEQNLGVPKKALYRAYLTACSIFTTARRAFLAKTSEFHTDTDTNTSALVNSSAVILLVNPAHQTALNMRKRLIQTGVLSAENELAFVGALQTVRDCAKESILWHHRRWLLHFLYEFSQVRDHISSSDVVLLHDPSKHLTILVPLESFRGEFILIAHACEIYPRNYHAWTHWGFCINTLSARIRSESTTTETKRQLIDILSQEILRIRHWVDLHVSDHSAIHHLSEFFRQHSLEPIQDLPSSLDLTTSLDQALSLVTSYPSYESLWLYLRAAVYFPKDQKHDKIRRCISSLANKDRISVQLASRTFIWWAHVVSDFVHYSFVGKSRRFYLKEGRMCISARLARTIMTGELDDRQLSENMQSASRLLTG